MAKPQVKKIIRDSIDIDIEGNINDLIETLSYYKDKGGYIDPDYDYDSVRYILYFDRLETDAEFNRRVAKEEKDREAEKRKKQTAKERRYKEFLKLKKEFEK